MYASQVASRLAPACILVVAFTFAAEVHADCRSLLHDAVKAVPCLICPCFFMPAFCCAETADTPEVQEFVHNSGRCCCRAMTRPDETDKGREARHVEAESDASLLPAVLSGQPIAY